ncbi:M48 family metalloprotease [Streptomyces sp. IF17]|nr:M48 family metalloprotease [Streptomyces alkaliphilus]
MTTARVWGRGVLAVGLLAGFYALAFTLVALTLVLVLVSLWMVVAAPYRAGPWALALGAGIPAVFALVHGVVTVSRAEQHPPGSVPLRRSDAPGLWRLVEELAERMGTRPPTRMYLTAEVNASVSERPRMLGLLVGERTMYLGVPLLTNLREPELRAVLCHELGHYAGRHTRFGALTHRGAAALDSTLFRLRMTARSENGTPGYARLFRAVIELYARVYLRVSLSVRRRQELEADAGALAEVGAETTAEALREVHALGFAWAGFRDRFLLPIQGLGFVPDDVFAAFTDMVRDPAVRERMAELRARPVEASRSPLDSHPPLSRRLELIGAPPPGDHRATDGEPPSPIAREPLLRVQQRMLDAARDPVTPLPRAQWTDLAAEAFAIELAALLLDAAHALAPDGDRGLDPVLDLLERGEGERLARRLTTAPGPHDQLAEALYALVGQALVGRNLARWAPGWTEGYRLEYRRGTGGDPEVLAALVAAAARDAGAVDGLRRELVRLGADPGAPVPLVLRTVAAPAGRTRVRRTGGRMPEHLARELRRQRTVRGFTLGVLAVVGVIWVVALAGSDPSRPYSPPVTNLPTGPTTGPTGGPDASGFPGLPEPPTIPYPRDVPGLPGSGFTYPPPIVTIPPYESWGVLTPIPHTVRPGDTLSGIACRYDTTVEHLQRMNDMGSRTEIRVGEELRVPNGPLESGAACG